MLTGCMATRLTAADDATVPIGQFAEQIQIFVVDEHRPGTDAINADWIPFDHLFAGLVSWISWNHGSELLGLCSGFE